MALVRNVVCLLIGILITCAGGYSLYQESQYISLEKNLERLREPDSAPQVLHELEEQEERYSKALTTLDYPRYLRRLALFDIELAALYPADSAQRMDYEKKASHLLRTAIEKSPLDSTKWLELALLQHSLGKSGEARLSLKAAALTGPYTPFYLYPRIKLYLVYWPLLSSEMQEIMVTMLDSTLHNRLHEFLGNIEREQYLIPIKEMFAEDHELIGKIEKALRWYKKRELIK